MPDTPAPRPSWRKRHWRLVMVLLVLLVPALLFAGWAAFTLGFSYSTGDRAGYVQKLSKKGWLCKTWEGELAMANLPGSMPQIFTFTVRSDSIANIVEQNIG